jgi:hypothetical protein
MQLGPKPSDGLEFTPQVGSEQSGRRPALVISPKAHNGKVSLALFCPIPAGEQERQPWFGVPMPGLGSPPRRWINRSPTGVSVNRRPLAGSAQGRDPGW